MKTKFSSLFFVLVLCLVFDGVAQQSTKVVVRAKAKDAKFIGSSMGGAHVKITEVQSGKILAQGITKGSTGDTDRLINPQQRYDNLSTEGAAKFEADLKLSKPTFVTISATAPMAQKQSRVRTSTQIWLIPGKDIVGDGVVLGIPGFAIDILQPQAHEVNPHETITITANTVMMCGCSITPGGLWDSNEMEFTAIITKGDQEIDRKNMHFTGKTSTFETTFTPKESGAYEITVYGFDRRTGNTGVDRTTFIKK